MSAEATVTRKIRVHPHAAVLFIKSQSGTLQKAGMEGIMNSDDAGADRVDVTVTPMGMKIVDNGKGFPSAKEVEEFFEEFGKPHEVDDEGVSTDAKFGTFRIGRGQMFAYGRNVWRTGTVRMEVDIDNMGLDYDLTYNMEDVPGCTVEIEFYEPLTLSELDTTVKEIGHLCRFMDIDLYVNGHQVNTPPAKLKDWTHENELAWVRVDNSDNRRNTFGLQIYQQGVLVETIPERTYGLSGIVVTKQALPLNTSRNEVIRKSTSWKKIVALIRNQAAKTLSKKTRKLSESEIENIANTIATGSHEFEDLEKMKFIPDVSGKLWSVKMIKAALRSQSENRLFNLTPMGDMQVSLAAEGSAIGDRAMQMKKGLVIASHFLVSLNQERTVEGLRRALEIIGFACNSWLRTGREGDYTKLKVSDYHNELFPGHGAKLEVVSLDEMTDGMSSEYRLIEQNKQTPKEKVILAAMGSMMWNLGNHRGRSRRLIIGDSTTARAWTDGKTYIAFDRKYLRGLGLTSESDWVELAMLVCHEWCHDCDSHESHMHGPEFYESYHNLTMRVAARMSRNGLNSFRARMAARAKGVTAAMRKELKYEAAAYAAAALLLSEDEKEADAKREAEARQAAEDLSTSPIKRKRKKATAKA